MVKECSKLLASKGLKIAFIESASAGRMCSEFSLCQESGKILVSGLTCYEAQTKEKVLKVPYEMIAIHTPESAEVTHYLARKGSDFFGADITVAITGLLSPGGSESKEKPVGTMFIHVYSKKSSIVRRDIFEGTPEVKMLKAIDKIAQLIITKIEDL